MNIDKELEALGSLRSQQIGDLLLESFSSDCDTLAVELGQAFFSLDKMSEHFERTLRRIHRQQLLAESKRR